VATIFQDFPGLSRSWNFKEKNSGLSGRENPGISRQGKA